MNRRQREKQGQRGYEGSCHTERFLMSNKPHRRVVKRRPHSQAFELSKALPRRTWSDICALPHPTLLHTNPIHTHSRVSRLRVFSPLAEISVLEENDA